MAVRTDTGTVLRMLRKLLHNEADHPPDLSDETAAHRNLTEDQKRERASFNRHYFVGRREGLFLAISAIGEALGEK